MPSGPSYFYVIFAVGFVLLYRLARPPQRIADPDLRHTPLSFGVQLACLLFIVFMQAHGPAASVLDGWLGYIFDIVLAGYLVRQYANLHARLRQANPTNFDRAA